MSVGDQYYTYDVFHDGATLGSGASNPVVVATVIPALDTAVYGEDVQAGGIGVALDLTGCKTNVEKVSGAY